MEFCVQYWDWAVASPYTMISYAVFLLGTILLLGEIPRDSYLNQIQQVVFVLLYGAFRSKCPRAKRFVMGSAGWAAWTLIIAIIGFGGVRFELSAVFAISAAYGGVIWALRRFAIEDFRLAPRYYVGCIITMALFGVISSSNWRIDPGFQPYYFILNIMLLAMLLLFYVMFYAINQSYGENLELLAQQASLEAQQRLLLLSQKSYEELKLLRHEIKNHDAYIEMLVFNRQYDELEEYLRKRSGIPFDSLRQISCGNQVIDAVINQNMAVAKLEEVCLEVRAAVPKSLSVEDSDLFALLNNLLSNAIESSAAAGIPSPVIRLELHQKREYLFVHMENPVDPSVDARDRLRLRTTKENRELHGYGTKVIQRIAEKYNGYVQYDIKDRMFISDLMLAATEV